MGRGGVLDEQRQQIELSTDDLLALKAALEIAEGELRRGEAPTAGEAPEVLAPLVARASGWVEGGVPLRAALSRREAALLAHYVGAALRLRGYVVGRPEANQRFVDLYRALKALTGGKPGLRDRLRGLLRKT